VKPLSPCRLRASVEIATVGETHCGDCVGLERSVSRARCRLFGALLSHSHVTRRGEETGWNPVVLLPERCDECKRMAR